MDLRVNHLVEQMEKLGYMRFQIQSILREATEGANLDSLTPTQTEQVVDYLEDYLAFAQRCKKSNGS
ncbi:hypothetical protein [Sporomusa aerivorans]|uniref:hypothetical protein n=1 Tax=Sporomusa aerivorans TaxID=204936 RepID=UPI00352B3EC1